MELIDKYENLKAFNLEDKDMKYLVGGGTTRYNALGINESVDALIQQEN